MSKAELRRVWELDELSEIGPPSTEPQGYESWWRSRYQRVLNEGAPQQSVDRAWPPWKHWNHWLGTQRLWSYAGADGMPIGGWLVLPRGPVERGLVVSHGYGGRGSVDTNLLLPGTVYAFPCCRGLGRSETASIPADAGAHVTHGLENRETYVLGGCIEDIWRSVSALLDLFPEVEGKVGFLGSSFGGGIGALAMAWDPRIDRGYLGLPTFGHHPLRLSIPSWGSTRALARYVDQHPQARNVLCWYDAASAAKRVTQPVLAAPALCDPVVPPPGQFAVTNALAGDKELFVRQCGHFDGPQTPREQRELWRRQRDWFSFA